MRVTRQVTKLIRIVAVAALAPLGLLSTLAHASAVEEQLDCKSTGHVFISALMNSGEIQSKPMHVEKNSINAFRPAHGVKLTAFDFRSSWCSAMRRVIRSSSRARETPSRTGHTA